MYKIIIKIKTNIKNHDFFINMSLFDNMLKSDETLFKDPIALDYDYLPKLLPHRESEQKAIVESIRPLFLNRNGKNIILIGAPGIGKTAASKFVLRELDEKNDEIKQIYISCWQKNSSYKVLTEVCHELGYRLTHNKRTDELFNEIKRILNKGTAVFVFDEIDKAEDNDFLYMILEEIYKKSIILITNYEDWIIDLDERIRSRLVPEIIEFKEYNYEETRDIIKERVKFAFFDAVINDEIIDIISKYATDKGDIRTGLHLLREAANFAESRARKKVILDDVSKAFEKLIEFKKKKSESLDLYEKKILEFIKNNTGMKIGDLFKLFNSEDQDITYRTFQRKIKSLSENGFLSTKKIKGGKEGSTTIINYDSTKKLTDF